MSWIQDKWHGLRFNRLDFDRNYVIDQVLSQKPRSRVLLVHRRGGKQQTIMKLSDPALANPLEVDCLRSLRHSGVARYLGHGLTRDHQLWMETEYIDGLSLSAWLNGQLPAKGTVGDHFLQLLSVVQYLHCCGWLHGDLSPQNVLVAEGRRGVVLIDFEYVQMIDQAKKRLMPRRHSISFASPHEVAGGATTESCEQFSLGKLGLMLLGHFEERATSTMEAVLQRAASPRAEDRYPSLQAVVHHLKKSMDTLHGNDSASPVADTESPDSR
ncbi:MAG: protein kinase [Planctomycetota bacterium]